MIILQANEKMKAIYQKTISVMDQNVEWNGTFMISNNTLILPGVLKSLFFNFDDKRAMGSVVDEDVKESVRDMKDNPTLESAINMSLYIFGKWGKIKGIGVDKSYEQLTDLVDGIFTEIHVTTSVTANYCRFYCNDVQLTYEEVIEKLYDYLIGVDEENEDDNNDKKAGKEKNASEEFGDENEAPMSKMGLWHKLVWKMVDCKFPKVEISESERMSKRIGKGFYLTSYICSSCENSLYMVVYSTEEEFKIDTDKGQIITTRNYTCPVCHKFYTAFPYKMLADGDAFLMDFEDDEVAYEDYLELVGSDGAKVMNCGFNRFVDEELNRKYTENDLPELTWKRRVYDLFEDDLEEMSDEEIEEITDIYDEGMLPEKLNESEIEKYVEEIEKQRKKRKITYKNNGEKKNHFSLAAIKVKGKNTTEKSKKERVIREVSKNDVAKEEAVKNEVKRALKLTPSKPFSSKRSKVIVAKRFIDSGDTLGFSKYMENMDEDDLKEFVMDVNSQTATSNDDKENEAVIEERKKIKIEFAKIATEKLAKTQQKIILDMAMEVKQKGYQDMKKFFDILNNKQCVDNLCEFKNQILDNLMKWMQSRGEMELKLITGKLPEMITKDQYKQFKKKILEYEDIDNSKYLKQLEEKLDKSENAFIKELISKYSKSMGNRNMLLTLIDKIKNGGYKRENSEPYLEELNDKLYYLDEQLLERLVPEVMDLSFFEGLEIYQKIEKSNFLPELKKEYLTKINKRLESLKKDECKSLVNKLIKDTGLANKSVNGIYIYDVRKMEATDSSGDDVVIIKNAMNTYVECDKYEYPLLIYDASKNDDGERGFTLTPDKIYYNMGRDSGFIQIANVSSIYVEGGLFGKGVYVKYNNGQSIKISGNVKDKDKLSKLCNSLTGFIKYLKEKPDSRSIDYLSKEKHVNKCCYRCGFTFSEGHICPKCGGRNR